jgi:hypothetical protein
MIEKMDVLQATIMIDSTRGPGRDATQQSFHEWVSMHPNSAAPVPGEGPTLPVEQSEGSIDGKLPDVALPNSLAQHGVLFGWRLAAQSGMSQLASLQIGPGAEDAVGAAHGPHDRGRDASNLSSPGRLDPYLPRQGRVARTDGNGSTSSAASISDRIRQGDAARASDLSSLAAIAAWPERSLRWITSSEGRVTMWLRDYRIEIDEVPALLDQLLDKYGELAHLHRIMINGVEAWRRNELPVLEQR